jgi:hypothetical protein
MRVGRRASARSTSAPSSRSSPQDCDPEAAGARYVEGGAVLERVGELGFRPGEVEAGDDVAALADGGVGDLDVDRRVGATQDHRCQRHHHAETLCRLLGGTGDGVDRAVERQPAFEMQRGRPLDLQVAPAVGSLVLDEVGRHSGERLRVLHQRERQFEGAQQVGLRVGLGRGDEGIEHAHVGGWCGDPALGGQLESRHRTQAPVEVEVQLGLGHHLQQASNGRNCRCHRRAQSRSVSERRDATEHSSFHPNPGTVSIA